MKEKEKMWTKQQKTATTRGANRYSKWDRRQTYMWVNGDRPTALTEKKTVQKENLTT